MSVFDVLSRIEDDRKGKGECTFNGYAEDYLSLLDDDSSLRPLLEGVVELDDNARVMVNYRFAVNVSAISNQIIRYKDATKLPKEALSVPLILYSHTLNDQGFAYVLNQAATSTDYLYAKGRYYCLTEQYGLFEDYRNDVLTDVLLDDNHLLDVYDKLLNGQRKIGALQREIDSSVYRSFQEYMALALALAEENKAYVTSLFTSSEGIDRGPVIYDMIEKWFLLKKSVYVQYMSNKQLLNDENEGNIRLQRQKAKQHVDEIPIMAFSEMWRL